MVDLIGFAGKKSFLGVWRSSISNLTKDRCGVLLQKMINGFLCISWQTVAGLDGIIEGITEDDRAILRRNGQIFLNGEAGVKSNAFAFSQRMLGTEDGIEGIVAGIEKRRSLLKLLTKSFNIMAATFIISGVKISF